MLNPILGVYWHLIYLQLGVSIIFQKVGDRRQDRLRILALHFEFGIWLLTLIFASWQIWGKHFPGTRRRNPSSHYLIRWGRRTLNSPGQWFLGSCSRWLWTVFSSDDLGALAEKSSHWGLKGVKKLQVLLSIALFPVSNIIPIKAVGCTEIQSERQLGRGSIPLMFTVC